MANHVSYSIYNSAKLDSFEVNPGETRRVKLRATSDELYTNADSSFYTISTPEDNTTYFSGTKLFYFGTRYYDPELGIWLSVDPAGQFWNPYGYHNNPALMIDPNGDFFFGAILGLLGTALGVAGTALGVAGIGVGTAAGAAGIGIGAAGIGVGVAGIGVGAVGIGLGLGLGVITDPFAYQSSGGVNNVIHNWEGIKTGEGEGFKKFTTSFAAGWIAGGNDFRNAMTLGAFGEPLGYFSGVSLGISHNIAFDKSTFDPEAIGVASYMLSKMYGYGPQGSWTKIGGDITWSNHLLNEEVIVPYSNGSRYTESRNRFHYMNMKIEMQEYYADRRTGNNRNSNGQKNYNYYGHRLLGGLLGPKLMYYGFEVWGEPYTRWDIDDYYDDGNIGYPMEGPYDTMW